MNIENKNVGAGTSSGHATIIDKKDERREKINRVVI